MLSVAGEGRSRPRVEAATPEFKGNALRHLLGLDDMSTGDVFDRKGAMERLGHQLRTVMTFRTEK